MTDYLFQLSFNGFWIAYEWTKLSPVNTILAIIVIGLLWAAYKITFRKVNV